MVTFSHVYNVITSITTITICLAASLLEFMFSSMIFTLSLILKIVLYGDRDQGYCPRSFISSHLISSYSASHPILLTNFMDWTESNTIDLTSLDLESEEDWLTGLQSFISEVTSSGSIPLSLSSQSSVTGTASGTGTGTHTGLASEASYGEVRADKYFVLSCVLLISRG